MVLLLVYSAMILRLRPGCLRWQHSENADGRGQLEGKARQKICPRARKKRDRERDKRERERTSEERWKGRNEEGKKNKEEEKKLWIREDESERRRRRRPIAAGRAE